MTDVTRRDLLAAGLAVPAASLFASVARAQGGPSRGDSGVIPDAAVTAISPREQLLFDFDWKFRFGHGRDPSKDLGFGFGQSDFSKTGLFHVATSDFDDSGWRTLNLPHDWAVEMPFVHDDAGEGDEQLRSHGYKPLGRRYPETSVGWYRRKFKIPASDVGRRIWVEFDGAVRDVLVFVNGCLIGRNNNAYVPFRFDVTDFLTYGGTNIIVVRVDASYGAGWFYEGAGLYRHVWLLKTDAVNLGRWDSVVRCTPRANDARVELSSVVFNTSEMACQARVVWTIADASGTVAATARSALQTIPAGGSATFHASANLNHPNVWSVENPHLYAARINVECDGISRDAERVDFGVRSAVFDPGKGFFLNGEPLKIQGVCNHQDHAGVGAALPDRLQAFRVGVMRDMGCNAIRTSHNMPTPELVDACDRMGVMMMCETRQMSSSAEGMAQLETMIKRYRNSPSIILWSIGNEETALQKAMAEQGARIAVALVRRCHQLDPTRLVTAAVNDDNEQGVSDALDVIGFNYVQWFPDKFHATHPTLPIVGSETSSAISTRGEYVTDPHRNVMSSYDGVVPWGKTPQDWWTFYAERGWAAGGFAWTGFDYRGEPTPYGWPSISSQFGIVDMCGFPKDYFYYYKAWWRKVASLHVFPHWNWPGKEGSEIAIWVYSNLDEVELLVNGRSLGRQTVPALGHLQWSAIYQPGAIEARGYRNGVRVLTERRETTGAPVAIRLTPDRREIHADGEDVVVLTVDVLDEQGRQVPTANPKLAFKVSGPGALIGVGNGDPNCHEGDKEPRRSLFNGLAQVIVQASRAPGQIVIEAVTEGAGPNLAPARISIDAKAGPLRPA
ncbi:MAG: glycoside hydrolase family 2 sugar binding protein, partial [Gammaproteobacteria bacterium]|nr:glycoside hydrolase family 2 sugar binding protein [Gammaproteobacteria bacterium]